MSTVVVPTPPRDERLYWRAAFLAPAVLAPLWIVAGRALGFPLPLPTVAGTAVVLLLSAVVYTDLKARRIPNWATYTAAAWALVLVVLGVVLGDPPEGSVLGIPPADEAFAGFLLGFFGMLLLFNVFGGGAGDVKLVAALGALLGASAIMMVLFYAYIVAGAFSLAFVMWKVGPGTLLRAAGARVFRGRVRPPAVPVGETLRTHVPMAPFLCIGVILTLALA